MGLSAVPTLRAGGWTRLTTGDMSGLISRVQEKRVVCKQSYHVDHGQ